MKVPTTIMFGPQDALYPAQDSVALALAASNGLWCDRVSLGRGEAALTEAGGQSGDRARIKERRPRA